ncbi:DUF1707 domain-containing protein [uncultured Tessaracoccus sp.]|uniref:DUF1707 SHOCT-like domain-containing protein n=1 Tax=uncultured Tessaracoccus sp. TaxID=905023 RepID=UPI00261B2950|nr:DUF1707 domain-containing protein [uncultured Tessaracoccus sp.]
MSENHPAPRLRIGDADRDAALTVLQEAHAAGRLDLAELEERQEQALHARYRVDLDELINDLPEGRVLITQSDAAPASAPAVSARSSHVPTRVGEDRPFRLALLSGRNIVLEPGSPGLRSFAFWGGNEIYLRDCMGPGAVVTLDVSAVMGGHDIYIPPGVRVVDECVAIMAGNDIDAAAMGDGSNGTLILRGFLFWAGCDVHLDPQTVQRHGQH